MAVWPGGPLVQVGQVGPVGPLRCGYYEKPRERYYEGPKQGAVQGLPRMLLADPGNELWVGRRGRWEGAILRGPRSRPGPTLRRLLDMNIGFVGQAVAKEPYQGGQGAAQGDP